MEPICLAYHHIFFFLFYFLVVCLFVLLIVYVFVVVGHWPAAYTSQRVVVDVGVDSRANSPASPSHNKETPHGNSHAMGSTPHCKPFLFIVILLAHPATCSYLPPASPSSTTNLNHLLLSSAVSTSTLLQPLNGEGSPCLCWQRRRRLCWYMPQAKQSCGNKQRTQLSQH